MYKRNNCLSLGDGTAKVNNAVPKKNDIGNINAEPKRTLTIDAETGQDQEDEGQWLTQGSKQVCVLDFHEIKS